MSLKRTQEMRSAKMTQLILDTTLDTIFELGYQNTSTNEVVKRAGVSRGALLHHFPSKTALITAAIRYQLSNEIDQIRSIAVDVSNGKVSLKEFLDYLWNRFSGRLYMITMDYISAARTNESLREELIPITKEFHQGLNDTWDLLFQESNLSSDEVATALNMTLCLFRGMGMQTVIRDDPAYFEAMLNTCFSILDNLLSPEKGQTNQYG